MPGEKANDHTPSTRLGSLLSHFPHRFSLPGEKKKLNAGAMIRYIKELEHHRREELGICFEAWLAGGGYFPPFRSIRAAAAAPAAPSVGHNRARQRRRARRREEGTTGAAAASSAGAELCVCSKNLTNTKTLSTLVECAPRSAARWARRVGPRQLQSVPSDAGTHDIHQHRGHFLVAVAEGRVQSGPAVERPELRAGPEQHVDDVGRASLPGDGV